jgi:CBS domain containing-hemolysin-like protein
MMGWPVLALGVAAGALGTGLAVGAAAVSRLELSRWISQRRHGAELAVTLLSAPGKVLGPANALASAGIVLTGLGLAALLAPLPTPVALAVLLGAVPLLAAVVHVLPRAVGRRWAEPLMRAAAPSLSRAARLLGPFTPGPASGTGVEHAAGSGAAREEEIAVIAGVIAFTERPVREPMTPRTQIVALDEGASARDAGAMFRESGYSRLPVYRESLDQITGMAYVFDLLKVGPDEPLPLRPVLVAPESRRCADLLFEMQRERRQMAVVLDEFGGTAGIVTLEDLLEELVGEIFDETDLGAAAGPAAERALLEIDGTTPTQELAEHFGVVLPAAAQSVGGLLTAAVGRIPEAGERILIGELEFDVTRASATRVERLLVRRAGSVRITVGGL